jgi:hypothetical protein
MFVRRALTVVAGVAALFAVAGPAHAGQVPSFPLTCEGEAGVMMDTLGTEVGYGAACYSDQGFHSNCVFFTEERPPVDGNRRTCYVNFG